jgi:hypothetical protein
MIPAERAELDATVLRNGVRASTRHRAYAAHRLRPTTQELDSDFARRCLALEAFQQYMLAAEDTLTWICALMEWEPLGAPETSILAKLDSVQIGRTVGSGTARRDYTEATLLQRFENMGVADLRAALKLPSDEDIGRRADWPDTVDRSINRYLNSWLAGLRRIVRGRLDGDRAMVRAYNKAKHGLLGLFDHDPDGQPAVVMLSAAHGYDAEPIELNRAFIRALPLDIERRINWTVRMVAVLQEILAFMLGVHFGEWTDTPEWVEEAYKLDGSLH